MKPQTLLAVAACFAVSLPAVADITNYSFSGVYNVAGGSQTYTGSFTTVDPALTSVRPASAPDVTLPQFASIWSGTSNFFTGGIDLDITFASGTKITASSFDIVVNNTTFQGEGSPYPMGLSVQLYPSEISIAAPTSDVCATPTGVCGEDDDPLYHDATQAAIMTISNVYFAFYNGPDGDSHVMPNLADTFGAANGGLGIITPNSYGFTTTQLTQLTSLSSTVTASPVPVPAAWLLMASGLVGCYSQARRNRA